MQDLNAHIIAIRDIIAIFVVLRIDWCCLLELHAVVHQMNLPHGHSRTKVDDRNI